MAVQPCMELTPIKKSKKKSKYYDDSNKLVIGKMKGETGGVAIEEFVGSKP